MGTRPQLIVVSCLSVGISLTVGFRPQVVVVSDLSVGIPLTVGFWAFMEPSALTEPLHILSFLTVEFWLSRSLFTNFYFSRCNFGYHGAFFTNFSFTRWNFGYHGAFSRTFLSHGAISAITEPFHELFFLTV
jgi:hypothetical protein